jgi:hypothetical protein
MRLDDGNGSSDPVLGPDQVADLGGARPDWV